MSLAAIDGIADALTATREFLFPVETGKWARMAVVAFFVGGAGGTGSIGGGGNGGTDSAPASGVPEVVVSDVLIAAFVAVLGVILLVGLLYAVLGAVMEFVLVESLRQDAVHLRQYVGRYWWPGLRLLGFRVGVGLLTLITAVLVGGVAFLAAGGVGAADQPARLLGVVLIAGPVLLAIGVGAALVLAFTTAFVVPVMLLEGTSVLGGWRRFWPTLRQAWKEYAAYVLVSVVLQFAVSLLVGLVFAILAVVVVVPFGALGLGVYLLAGGQFDPFTIAVLGGIGVVALSILVVVAAVVSVPVVTYFRYYALFVLGDTEPDFDVITERRDSVRNNEAGA